MIVSTLLLHLLEAAKSLLGEVADVLQEPLNLLWLLLVVRLGVDEPDSVLAAGELDKEVGLDGVREESFLSLLAILVHDISHNCEVHVKIIWVLLHLVSRLHDELVILRVPMREQEHHHALHHLLLLEVGQPVRFEDGLA